MRWSEHFERDRQHQPDRTDITLGMCERVKSKPMEGYRQEYGWIVYKGHVPESGKYLRVSCCQTERQYGQRIGTATFAKK